MTIGKKVRNEADRINDQLDQEVDRFVAKGAASKYTGLAVSILLVSLMFLLLLWGFS